MPHFDALKIYSCRKQCQKRRNCLQQAIFPFLTMFSTLCDTYFSFQMHFKCPEPPTPPLEFWQKCGNRIHEWGRVDIAQHLCRIQFLIKCGDGVFWN